jgi:hypothetical protein
MVPGAENAQRMQMIEDFNLRQLWRLTNILLKLRKRALNPTEMGHEE